MQTWGVVNKPTLSYLTGNQPPLKPFVLTLIPGGTGTVIGNMTLLGGNAASFDGVNSKSFASCSAATATSTGYVGKNWGTGNTKVIAQCTFYSPSDRNYDGGTGSDPTILSVWGSSDNATWTQLGTLGSVNYSPANNTTLQSSQIIQTTGYQYHKAVNDNPFQPFFSQILFYEYA